MPEDAGGGRQPPRREENTMDEQTYWNGNGKHQEAYTKEWEELVPSSGKAGTLQGEVLRASSRLYYRWFNDGDRISNGGAPVDSSAENAWGFLHLAVTRMPASRELAAIRWLAETTAAAAGEEEYEAALEALADAAVEFAATRPLVPTDSDMCGREWRDHCLEACGLEEPEYDEDEDWEEDEE